MQKLKFLILSILIVSLLMACTVSPTQPAQPNHSSEQGLTDAAAKELIHRALDEIILLASEDPTFAVTQLLKGVEVIYSDQKLIDGVPYAKTTAAYQEIYDYYADVFTKDALDWILSTKFVDVDRTLYVSMAGGLTGWIVQNLEVTRIEQKDDLYYYQAAFYEIESTLTRQFTVQKTEEGYRISHTDYLPWTLMPENLKPETPSFAMGQ